MMPRAVHLGIPCTDMCVIGGHRESEELDALARLTKNVALHQEQRKGLCSVEQPLGTDLYRQTDWTKEFGGLSEPRRPWNYYKTTGCQLGVRCPFEHVYDKNAVLPSLDRPIRKKQLWMANFSLAPMTLSCEATEALLPPTHVHQVARGGGKNPGGKAQGIASTTGTYTPEQGAMYAVCN